MSIFAEAEKRQAVHRFKSRDQDADGNVQEFDVREDEEQNKKYEEIIELLLAAGYFRARIKGLSPFDKVVGGMTWCIQASNFDVDVDLLFQENSSIGQKIALTEKIVVVLPRMKCPHRLDPHQIQGLDFIHIFPVIQWLVKRAIETREEFGDYIRSYSVSQYSKFHTTPDEIEFESRKDKAVETIAELKQTYQPKRRFKKPDSSREADEETQVNMTLLEYGRRHGLARSVSQVDQDKAAKKKSLAARIGKGVDESKAAQEAEAERIAEEKRINTLMQDMAETADVTLSSSALGSIMGIQSAEIQQMAMEYEEKRVGRSTGDKEDKPTGAQAHQRMVNTLQKQIAAKQKEREEVEAKYNTWHEEYAVSQQRMAELQAYQQKISEEMENLKELETEENKDILKQLRGLVSMNENLKKQEQQFKAHCKEEMERLKAAISKLQSGEGEEDSEEKERLAAIAKQLEADKEKLQKIRLLLARKNREIALLQRKIDEVPSRTELTQYQRRFIELYNQVASTLTETRQFYILYNTLEDQKAFMEKEFGILTQIHDNFDMAMNTEKNKDLFLKQVEQILDGIKKDKEKLERRRQDEKMQRDTATDIYLELVEKQRNYYKTVKDFQEECRDRKSVV